MLSPAGDKTARLGYDMSQKQFEACVLSDQSIQRKTWSLFDTDYYQKKAYDHCPDASKSFICSKILLLLRLYVFLNMLSCLCWVAVYGAGTCHTVLFFLSILIITCTRALYLLFYRQSVVFLILLCRTFFIFGVSLLALPHLGSSFVWYCSLLLLLCLSSQSFSLAWGLSLLFLRMIRLPSKSCFASLLSLESFLFSPRCCIFIRVLVWDEEAPSPSTVPSQHF